MTSKNSGTGARAQHRVQMRKTGIGGSPVRVIGRLAERQPLTMREPIDDTKPCNGFVSAQAAVTRAKGIAVNVSCMTLRGLLSLHLRANVLGDNLSGSRADRRPAEGGGMAGERP